MQTEPMKLKTARMDLVAATPDLLRAELVGRAGLALALDAAVPETWPPPLNSVETVEYALGFLTSGADRAGWMGWYFLRTEGRVLVGQGGYCGRPEGGIVEVGYSLLPAHQKLGYATEAVRSLIDRAFSFDDVDAVTAQTMPELTPSIRVLERLGFKLMGAGSEDGSIRYSRARVRRSVG